MSSHHTSRNCVMTGFQGPTCPHGGESCARPLDLGQWLTGTMRAYRLVWCVRPYGKGLPNDCEPCNGWRRRGLPDRPDLVRSLPVTVGPYLRRLISIGAGPTSRGPVSGIPAHAAGRELHELLTVMNGLVAFESALVVRGSGPDPGDLADWNEPSTWTRSYGGLADGIWFFAEDVFGGQFGLTDEAVISFDPETGERTDFAPSLEAWAEAVITDFETATGYPLAHAWQQRWGPLGPRERLVPRTLFVLGGEFTLENLRVEDDRIGMLARAGVAVRLRDLPDGTPIELRTEG